MFKVKILQTDRRLGIKKGEVYRAERYQYDFEKVTLLSREPDGYDPECNQYIYQVAYWIDKQWMVVDGSRYVPLV